MTPTCEDCGAANAIEQDGRTLCLTCWIEEIGRRRPTGTMDRVRRERRRRDRAMSAMADPAQMHAREFGGER